MRLESEDIHSRMNEKSYYNMRNAIYTYYLHIRAKQKLNKYCMVSIMSPAAAITIISS